MKTINQLRAEEFSRMPEEEKANYAHIMLMIKEVEDENKETEAN